MFLLADKVIVATTTTRKVYLVNRKSDGKHVVTKEIPVDDLPKAERQSALNEVRESVSS